MLLVSISGQYITRERREEKVQMKFEEGRPTDLTVEGIKEEMNRWGKD